MVLGKVDLGIINHLKVNVSLPESLPKTLTECRLPEDPNLLMTTVFALQCAMLQKILSVLEILKRCLYLGSLIKLTTGTSETPILIYKTVGYYMHPFHPSCCIGRADSVNPTGAKSRSRLCQR